MKSTKLLFIILLVHNKWDYLLKSAKYTRTPPSIQSWCYWNHAYCQVWATEGYKGLQMTIIGEKRREELWTSKKKISDLSREGENIRDKRDIREHKTPRNQNKCYISYNILFLLSLDQSLSHCHLFNISISSHTFSLGKQLLYWKWDSVSRVFVTKAKRLFNNVGGDLCVIGNTMIGYYI